MKTFMKSTHTLWIQILFAALYVCAQNAIAEPTVMHFSDSKTQAVGKYVYNNSDTQPNILIKKPVLQTPSMPDPMALLRSKGQTASAPVLLQPEARVGEIKTTKPAKSSNSRNLTSKEKSRMPLVPPPPPVTPSFLVGPGFSEMPFSVEYMSKDDLNQKLKEIQLNLDDANSQLKDKQAEIADTKDKAKRFVSLFEEGVVSKRELEAAQKEASEADKEIERVKLKVTSLESQKKSVQSRLSDLSKRTVGTTASGKHKKK
jgi:hypothetical protein